MSLPPDLSNNFERVPLDWQACPQWICWKLVERGEGLKPTKLPINARSGALASVTNPADWCDFETAVAASANHSGIGFVFTQQAGFVGVDLDDTQGDEVAHARQVKIFQSFDSYSEKSPSGQGLHIICKGTIPSGKRRGHVEIYSSERFFTVTGNVYNPKPIMERQEPARTLWEEMGGAAQVENVVSDQPERESDKIVLSRAANAANGEKFKTLHSGNWQSLYPSQNEADLALINIFAFYSKNRAQIARLFRQSVLGQRDKAKRENYVGPMIEMALDREFSIIKGVSEFTAKFQADATANGTPKSNVFSFTEFTKEGRPPSYIWHRVFQRNYLYTITGLWGAGKSALAITVAVHAALGMPLCGHGMVASKVLMLCGENVEDVRLRVRAACILFGIDPDRLEGQLFFTRLPFAIDSQPARDAFIADASRFGPFDLCIIDTGPAHSQADDENSNRQAHELAIAIRALMEALGGPATIALMHPTKGATRDTVGSARGGGAFSGSVDGLCGVWRHENGTMEFFHCNKFRGPGFSPKFFDLQRHEFSELLDNFGEAAISVVAVPTDAKPKAATRITPSNRIALDALGECRHAAIETPQEVLDGLAKCSGQPLFAPFVAVHEAVWREHCYKLSISDGEQSAKKKAFGRSRTQLINLRLIHTFADYYWLPEWCSAPSISQRTE